MKDILSNVKKHILREGMNFHDLRYLLLNSEIRNKKEIENVASSVFEGNEIKDFNILREFIEFLNSKFNLNINVNFATTSKEKFIKILKQIWSIFVFLFVFYFIVGGIVIGKSNLIRHSNPIFPLSLLVFLIFMLASLEGLQIAVTTLRLKDLESIKDKYPRAARLQKKFKDVQITNNFLAGRQLLVIVVVFFTAQLTSFPNLNNFPFTSIVFPSFIPYFITRIFFKLGVLGALFVLWTGQLFPQFVANKNPQWFLNIYGMGNIFKLCLFFDLLEITRPGKWFSKKFKRGDYIYISQEERYRLEAENIKGYGCVNIKKSWNIDIDKSILDYSNSFIIFRNDISQIIDESLYLEANSPKPRFSTKLISLNENDSREAIITHEFPISLGKTGKIFTIIIRPTIGEFRNGDIIQSNVIINFESLVKSDAIEITNPTKHLIFRLVVSNKFYRIGSLHYKIIKQDEFVEKEIIIEEDNIQHKEEGDYYVFEYIRFYPEQDTIYKFEWNLSK